MVEYEVDSCEQLEFRSAFIDLDLKTASKSIYSLELKQKNSKY